MRAMVLTHTGPIAIKPSEYRDVPIAPAASSGSSGEDHCVRRVSYRSRRGRGPACRKIARDPGVSDCRTRRRPGAGARRFRHGDRIGIAWIYSADGTCELCRAGNENLCARFRGTGCDADGGYAEYVVAPEDSVYPIPQAFTDGANCRTSGNSVAVVIADRENPCR